MIRDRADCPLFDELAAGAFRTKLNIRFARICRYAEQVGLELETFDECLSSRKHAEAVEADVREATALGIRGTPAFVVNGILLFGLQSEEKLEAVIREELARHGS